MKIFYKTLVLAVFLTALAIVTPTFAQDVCADFEPNQALYAKYTEKYKGTLEEKEIAFASGNEYIQKYSACKDFDPQVNYLKKALPKLAEEITKLKEENKVRARYRRFDSALKALKADEIYASGKDILKSEPEKLDVVIVLALVGLDEVADNKNNTYNNEAISYAKSVLSKLAGAPEAKEYGVLQYSYKTKEDTLGWMNYAIGYIMFYGQNDRDSGLRYFYQATQHDSKAKDKFFVYGLIGDFYRDKAIKIGKDIIERIEENRKLNPNENPETYQTKMMYALQKGYAERTIDAYSRAYIIGKSATPAASQEYLDGLRGTLKTFYRFRFVTDDKTTADEVESGLVTYIASVSGKPFPSPTSEVQPVDPPAKEDAAPVPNNAAAPPLSAPPGKPAPKQIIAPPEGYKGKSEADKTSTKPKRRR